MPFHPAHRRAAPWQLIVAAIVVALLLVLYVGSFRGRSERTLEAPAAPSAPVVPPSGPPAQPSPGGG